MDTELPPPLPLPLPEFLQIGPVGQCKPAARICPVQLRPDRTDGRSAFMQFDTFCRLPDGVDGVTELRLARRGEPLLHPRFCDMVTVAVQRRLACAPAAPCPWEPLTEEQDVPPTAVAAP